MSFVFRDLDATTASSERGKTRSLGSFVFSPSLFLSQRRPSKKMTSSESTPLRSENAADQSYGSTPTAVSISSQEEEGSVKDGVEDGSLPRVQLTRKEFWLMLLGLFMTVCECWLMFMCWV